MGNSVVIDSKEKIVYAKLTDKMGKYMRKLTISNGDGRSILNCAGLSTLQEKYGYALEPRDDMYPNNDYNPTGITLKIFEDIQDNSEAILNLLREMFRRINMLDDGDFEEIESYLNLLGYSIEEELGWGNDPNIYSVTMLTDGDKDNRGKDISFLMRILGENHPELLIPYQEAMDSYTSGNYSSCIGQCRIIIETLFKKADIAYIEEDNGDDVAIYFKGIVNLANDVPPKGNPPKLTKEGVFKYWLTYQKRYNRTRLFATMYSVLSGLGPHSEENPSKEDALMLFRMTEDIVIWILQKKSTKLHNYNL